MQSYLLGFILLITIFCGDQQFAWFISASQQYTNLLKMINSTHPVDYIENSLKQKFWDL